MLNVGRYKGHMIKSLITRMSTSKNLVNKTNCTTFEKTKFKKNCWISYAENISNACISFSSIFLMHTRFFLVVCLCSKNRWRDFFFLLSFLHPLDGILKMNMIQRKVLKFISRPYGAEKKFHTMRLS